MTTQISDVAMIRRAQLLYEQHLLPDAKLLCLELLKRSPNHYQALMLLVDVAWGCRDKQEAFEYAQRLTKGYPRDGSAFSKLAELYNRSGRHSEAIRLLEKFNKKGPVDLTVLDALAKSHELAGDLDSAITLLDPLIDAGTESPAIAHRYASIKLEQKQHEKVIEVASRHLKNPTTTPGLLEALYFLLGRAYEAIRDFDNSFLAYDAANHVLPSENKIEKAVQEVDRLIQAFSAQRMARIPRAANNSRLPVFIVCMPRSGSTLIERIISAHPDVHAGGEFDILKRTAIQFNLTIGSTSPWPESIHDLDQNDVNELSASFLGELQALAPQAKRITNKYLWTWKYLGLLALLCPKAIIIDLRRDAVDNCVGIFTAHMHSSQSFARDLAQTGLHHREYERMMDHWHAVLGNPILKVNYEDIVADQETWSRRIIEHCGLEWDDRCLRFYEKGAQQSSTAAPTLSYQQVRQPIYKSSVSRAKKFEKHLGPLYEALGLPYPPAP